jgi:hypothetical protein
VMFVISFLRKYMPGKSDIFHGGWSILFQKATFENGGPFLVPSMPCIMSPTPWPIISYPITHVFSLLS